MSHVLKTLHHELYLFLLAVSGRMANPAPATPAQLEAEVGGAF